MENVDKLNVRVIAVDRLYGYVKARVLMSIIQKMIAEYQNFNAGNLSDKVFELFEKAKRVHYAGDPESLGDAIDAI